MFGACVRYLPFLKASDGLENVLHILKPYQDLMEISERGGGGLARVEKNFIRIDKDLARSGKGPARVGEDEELARA